MCVSYASGGALEHAAGGGGQALTAPMRPAATPIISQPHEPAGSVQTPMSRASPKNGSMSTEVCEPANSVTGPFRWVADQSGTVMRRESTNRHVG